MKQKDAEFAREVIAIMRRETKSLAARKRIAEIAIFIGNYTPAGKQVYADYIKTGAPT